MKDTQRFNYWLGAFFVLLLFGLFGGLHIMDLRGEEPRRALVAWEMIFQNQYLKPTIQGLPYYNKPPIFNWVVAICFQVFGDHNWVVRLPSILAFLLMGGIHYRFVATYLDKQTALWSVLFLFTGVHFLYFATVLSGELDLFYALFVYVQALLIFHFFQKQAWLKLFAWSYLLLGLGFLIKGLPSIAFQGLTFLGLAIYYKRWSWLFSWQHILGGLLGISPVIAYFWYYDIQFGNGWLYLVNLLEEASQKSAAEGKLWDIFGHLFEFPIQFIVDHLPWALILLFFIKEEHRAAIKKEPFLVFCLLFFVANIWLYWISPGSRNRYLYAFAPFFFTPLAYLYVRKPLLSLPKVLIFLCVMAGARIVYNYTVMSYQQKTMKNIQLYRQISEDALNASQGASIQTCCIPDSIFVNPSLGPLTLLEDTIFIPMYLPYQVPFYIQRERAEILPFKRDLSTPGIYLSTDTLSGKLIQSYPVWDDKTLYLFEMTNDLGRE